MNKVNQKIIPAIATMKNFEKFLESNLTFCILMDFHLSLLQDMILAIHKADKKVIVHQDLIKGVAGDEFGAQYLCQKMNVDGIISTKPKVLEAVKKCHKISIQRVFLIDSKSLNKSLQVANLLQPDYIEILPALAYNVIPRIQAETTIALICGGLAQNSMEIEQCIFAGAMAVSVSDPTLWFNKKAKL